MEKIRNLSVRRTILLYLAICLVCSFFLSAVIVGVATHAQEEVWWKYADHDKYLMAVDEMEGKAPAYNIEVIRPPDEKMSKRDYFISQVCDFLQTYTVLVLSITTSCVTVFLFYKHKLEDPIKELDLASKRIAKNDLDFHITYENRDEMGRLCQEFERMRRQLAQNNQELWRMIEEEKALRAAIAHDIRSPLSVLKGYQEMLMDYLPNGMIDTDKAMEMLAESMNQIGRMDIFVETMRKMNSLEQRYHYYDAIYNYDCTEYHKGTKEEINSYIESKLRNRNFSYFFSKKFADFAGLFMGFFATVMLAVLFWQDTGKNTYELLHTKPISAKKYVSGKIAGGFLVCLMVLAILNLVFWITCLIYTKGSGFEVNVTDFLIATGLYILPNMLMIVSVYALISLLFKNPLPAVPLLILYMIYSNMGSRNAEGKFGYFGRPFAIMVRFPGRFFDTAPPPMVIMNQSFLILASAGIFLICIQLWKKRRL